MGQGKVILRDNEFGPYRAADIVPARSVPTGAAAHRAKDPAKEAVKRRLIEAVEIMVRMAAENRNGTVLRSMLRKLDAATQASRLAALSGMMSGRGASGVTEAEMDRMEEAFRWIVFYVDDEVDRALVIEWAWGKVLGRSSDAWVASDPKRRSQQTLSRVFNQSLEKIVGGVGEFISLE